MVKDLPTVPSLSIKQALREVSKSFEIVCRHTLKQNVVDFTIKKKTKFWLKIYNAEESCYLATSTDVYRSGIEALSVYANEIQACSWTRKVIQQERIRLDQLREAAEKKAVDILN